MASNDSGSSVLANDLSAFLLRNDELGENISKPSSSPSPHGGPGGFGSPPMSPMASRGRSLSVISVDSDDIRNYHTLCYIPLGTVHEWKRFKTYGRACLGLYGSIIYW